MSNSAQFDGATFLPLFDQKRLSGQYQKVFELMKAGHWWRLKPLAERVGASESSVSAKTALIGCLAHSVGTVRQEQCLDAAVAIVQEQKQTGLRLIKGNKCQTKQHSQR